MIPANSKTTSDKNIGNSMSHRALQASRMQFDNPPLQFKFRFLMIQNHLPEISSFKNIGIFNNCIKFAAIAISVLKLQFHIRPV